MNLKDVRIAGRQENNKEIASVVGTDQVAEVLTASGKNQGEVKPLL
jgi:hypothetical protein